MARKNMPTRGYETIEIRAIIVSLRIEPPKKEIVLKK